MIQGWAWSAVLTVYMRFDFPHLNTQYFSFINRSQAGLFLTLKHKLYFVFYDFMQFQYISWINDLPLSNLSIFIISNFLRFNDTIRISMEDTNRHQTQPSIAQTNQFSYSLHTSPYYRLICNLIWLWETGLGPCFETKSLSIDPLWQY